MDEEDKEML